MFIFLHGLGDSSAGISQAFHFPPSVSCFFPNAPIRAVTLNGGQRMRAWYDLSALSGGLHKSSQDAQGIKESAASIIKHIESTGASDVYLGGFSQGAAISLAVLALCTPVLRQKMRAIFCCSGYLPIEDELVALMKQNGQNISTPVYLFHGTVDEVVPYAMAKRTLALLKDAGCSCVQLKSFVMGHSFCQEELEEIHRLVQ